ncbi:MAG: mandelate racemase/muconate lactonizing enzyme family protein [Proteobacteria bacterium]|nr:mandelate racemase/muconate lactonizing enzyme family protein [Pseudomonadota bacterium]
MKIKSIKASVHQYAVTLPMIDKPLEHRHFVFCEVETDEGHTGSGLTGAFLPWAVVTTLEGDLLSVVRDMDPRDTEAIHSKVWWTLNPRAFTGVISNALSALDIALWDIHGKMTGRTVAQLLGGYRDWAPSYITFGFPFFDNDQLVEYARKFVDEGNTRLKMVVAVDPGGWQEDARRIRVVRDAVGDDVQLMIDANYRFNPVDARLLCRAVEDCNLTWFEEPLHQNDARALADLRRHTNIPIAAGQMEGNRWRLRELVEHQAVDILQPNCCYNGGFTESLKAAHLAQAYNLPIANGGGWPIFNMHVFAGLMNGWCVEFHWGMHKVGQQFFENVPGPENDMVKLPDAPGLGFLPKYDALKESRVMSPDDLGEGGVRTRGTPKKGESGITKL